MSNKYQKLKEKITRGKDDTHKDHKYQVLYKYHKENGTISARVCNKIHISFRLYKDDPMDKDEFLAPPTHLDEFDQLIEGKKKLKNSLAELL